MKLQSVVGALLLACGAAHAGDETRRSWADASDEQVIDHVARHTYAYFERTSHPTTGFALDRTAFPDVSSIAATGFALAAHATAVAREWIPRREGILRVRRILSALSQAAPAHAVRGFFYHFVDVQSAARKGTSEVSVIDMALLAAGVRIARAYFRDDLEIAALAGRLLEPVEWDWFLDGPRNRFFMAWKPEASRKYGHPDARGGGFFCGSADHAVHWGAMTDEVVLMALLAGASRQHRVSAVGILRALDPGTRDAVRHSWDGSLFTYFMGASFLDPRRLGPTACGFDWFGNSARAVEANRRFAAAQKLPSWAFGSTACQGPDGRYRNYGAPPSAVEPVWDGTVASYGMLGAILHAPEAAIRAARELLALGAFEEGMGLADAVNWSKADKVWINPTRFGINQGMILLTLENYRSGFVGRQLEADPEISAVLDEAFPARRR